MLWDMVTKTCGSTGINSAVDCYYNGQFPIPENIGSVSYTSKDEVDSMQPLTITWSPSTEYREALITFANEMSSPVTFSLDCTGTFSTYAMVGTNQNNVKLTSLPCGGSATAEGGQVGGIAIVSNSGYASVTLSVRNGSTGLSGGAIAGIVIGSLVGLGLIVGVVIFIKRRKST